MNSVKWLIRKQGNDVNEINYVFIQLVQISGRTKTIILFFFHIDRVNNNFINIDSLIISLPSCM